MYQTRITAAELPVERLLGEYCFPERFREACRACPDYGNDWSCPPGVPSAAEALRPFRTAHVLGMQVFYDAQTRREVSTAEGAEAVRRASYGPAKRVLLETLLALEQTRSGAWTIAAGRCELCARCARRDGLPCRNAERMRYSFSALALIWRRWPGGSWVSSCCGRPMGCRSTMWRWPPFWSGEGQKQAGAASAAPALLCLHGQDQK